MLNKQRIFEILNKARYGDTASRIFDISLTTLILANLAAVSLESVESINNKVKDYSHNRSHDTINRTLRYYMFFHNEKSWNHKVSFIINKSIKIRFEKICCSIVKSEPAVFVFPYAGVMSSD